MQQHAIPQNVTQYQFRLVGDMTLKQFLELAGGLVLAYLFYASNLIVIFKWPLAIMSLVFGFGLAFFPIEERPLDVWITNFVKAIYQPTRFLWRKTFRLPSLFLYTSTPIQSTVTAVKTVKAPTLVRPEPQKTNLTADESARINSIDSLFSKLPTPPVTTPEPLTIIEKPTVKVRKLSPEDSLSSTIVFDAGKFKPKAESFATPPQVTQDAKNITVPQTQNFSIEKPTTTSSTSTPLPPPTTIAIPTVQQASKPVTPLAAPQTISLPAPPKSENIVVGMVVDKAGKMVENAIVQIVNDSGIPARAIKTNSLGQFYTSTPLAEGKYAIEVEKEGYSFAPVGLQIKNQLIPPLLIKSD